MPTALEEKNIHNVQRHLRELLLPPRPTLRSKMASLFVCTLGVVFSLNAHAAPAKKAGWAGIRWGMTEVEYNRAVSKVATRCKVAKSGKADQWCVRLGALKFAVTPVWDGAVKGVRLSSVWPGGENLMDERCRDVEAALALKHGSPLLASVEDHGKTKFNGGLANRWTHRKLWRGPGDVRISSECTFYDGAQRQGTVVVTYERIELPNWL